MPIFKIEQNIAVSEEALYLLRRAGETGLHTGHDPAIRRTAGFRELLDLKLIEDNDDNCDYAIYCPTELGHLILDIEKSHH